VLGGWFEPGGDQEGAAFVAVQGGGVEIQSSPRRYVSPSVDTV
jgi:hypothetical protein